MGGCTSVSVRVGARTTDLCGLWSKSGGAGSLGGVLALSKLRST